MKAVTSEWLSRAADGLSKQFALGLSSSPQSPQQTKQPTTPISQPLRDRLWRTEWLSASVHALLVGAGVLALFYYWFAVADRYHIFLYNHLDATPFDAITTSRYLRTCLKRAF